MDRTKGFGSGDAKSIAHLGITGKPNETLIRRIAELKGLAEPVNILTPAMEKGVEYENKISELLPGATHNPKFVSKQLSRDEYEIRNHIDYESVTSKVVWIELKTSIKSLEHNFNAYKEQLAWHYMLLKERAGDMRSELYLVVVNPNTEGIEKLRVDFGLITYELNAIKKGLELLPTVWASVSSYSEPPEIPGELLPDVLQEKALFIAEALKRIDEMNAAVDEFKIKMLEAMLAGNVKSIKFDNLAITLVPSSLKSTIDTKKLKKNYPKAAAACSKVTELKPYIIITTK